MNTKHYLHIAYQVTLNDGRTFVGDSLLWIEKHNLDDIRKMLMEVIKQKIGLDSCPLPTIISLTEISKDLYDVLSLEHDDDG